MYSLNYFDEYYNKIIILIYINNNTYNFMLSNSENGINNYGAMGVSEKISKLGNLINLSLDFA